jgi:polyhydroxyalkanoate synthesis regulator phasin
MMERALKLMQDPRVMKALQDPRVMQGVMAAVTLRARVQQQMESRVGELARSLNLATRSEVKELRRNLDRLQRELDLQRGGDGRGHHGAGDL